jgi:hypothetical protein
MRRFSVSDESSHPEQTSEFDNLQIVPKSVDVKRRIRSILMSNILFKRLAEEQIERCLDVMFEKRVKAGEAIIKQGRT